MRRSHPPVPWAYRIVVAILIWPALLLTRRRWSGRENIPAKGGFVAAANHISNLDFIPVVHMLTVWAGAPKVLIKDSVLRVPVVGRLLKAAGFISVQRGTAAAASAISGAVKALRGGECVLVYPEGTITKDPDLWPMRGRPGAVKAALEADVPLVPIAQWGAQELLPRHAKRPRLFPPTKVVVKVGPAIDLADLKDRPDAVKAGTDRLMAAITAMVAELRGQTPPAEPFNQFAAESA